MIQEKRDDALVVKMIAKEKARTRNNIALDIKEDGESIATGWWRGRKVEKSKLINRHIPLQKLNDKLNFFIQ